MLRKIIIYLFFIFFCFSFLPSAKSQSKNDDLFSSISNKSVAFLEKNQPEKALEIAENLVQEFPKNPDSYQLLARIYIDLYEKGIENCDKAINTFKNALELDSANFKTWNNLGDFYIRLGKTGEAKKAILKALNLNPNTPTVYINLGLIALQEKQYKVALVHFVEAKNYLNSVPPEDFRKIVEKDIENYIKKTRLLLKK